MNRLFQRVFTVALISTSATVFAQETSPTTDVRQLVQQIQAQIATSEAKVTAPAAYEPASKALALLCQSDPFFFRDEPPFAPAWTPPEVLKLGPTWVDIAPDRAHVEFGGGFHHFGYELMRDNADSDKENGWTLSFYSEDKPGKILKSFKIGKTEHVDQKQFVDRALTEFERRASLPGNADKSVTERLVFLLKFNELELARKSIRDCAADNPNDWSDHLLAYIVDSKTDPAASGRLDAWAQKQGDCSAWMLAAHAYDLAGDHDDAERCTKTALSMPVDEPEWLPTNARHRGATLCLRLLAARRYPTCARLCDALLAFAGGDYMRSEISAIGNLARHAAAADPAPVPPAFEDGLVFEPFKGIDLSRLIVSKATTTPAAARFSDPAQARMVEYLDHRIAADPGSRRIYAEKIDYLFSIKRKDEALAACKTATEIFPKWWRPQMVLAVSADMDSRREAEASFRKWVEANRAFIHWWYLCRLERDAGRDGPAVEALRNAVKYPLENVDDDATWVPAAFAFDAASYAYQRTQYALVLEIDRIWSSPKPPYSYFDDNIYAFNAAAELALGEFDAAKADADKAVKAASQHAIWAQHLSELQKAAGARDRDYKYDPGSSGADWSLFPRQ